MWRMKIDYLEGRKLNRRPAPKATTPTNKNQNREDAVDRGCELIDLPFSEIIPLDELRLETVEGRPSGN